jgi:bacterioferritin
MCLILAKLAAMNELKNDSKKDYPFLTDIETIRRRARKHILDGAVTTSYEGDVKTAIRLLNEALATEIVCTLRYKSHYYLADGIHAQSVAAEFLEHATEEQQHADQISERIKQLGGQPNWSPEGILSRSHAEFRNGDTLVDLIQEDLIAERIAIDSYREMIQFFGQKDPTSRRLMEEILAKEEEHADDLADLLLTFSPDRKASNSRDVA